MNKYLWQKNKDKVDWTPSKETIRGLFGEANAYMRNILRKMRGGEKTNGRNPGKDNH